MARWINRHPGAAGRWGLAALPFLLVLAVYVAGSSARQAANPDDKLLPSGGQLVASVQRNEQGRAPAAPTNEDSSMAESPPLASEIRTRKPTVCVGRENFETFLCSSVTLSYCGKQCPFFAIGF